MLEGIHKSKASWVCICICCLSSMSVLPFQARYLSPHLFSSPTLSLKTPCRRNSPCDRVYFVCVAGSMLNPIPFVGLDIIVTSFRNLYIVQCRIKGKTN